ncbi:hypothetical protein [Burkholderia diffusa]|nr:hypothetical protein [Burkholderia diffusa]MBM2655862.1 hypothetical protein [Burkholderia diffusa]
MNSEVPDAFVGARVLIAMRVPSSSRGKTTREPAPHVAGSFATFSSCPCRGHFEVRRPPDGHDRQGASRRLGRQRTVRRAKTVPKCTGWIDGMHVAEMNVQKILIAEDVLRYKPADRHHEKTESRDIRKDAVLKHSEQAEK